MIRQSDYLRKRRNTKPFSEPPNTDPITAAEIMEMRYGCNSEIGQIEIPLNLVQIYVMDTWVKKLPVCYGTAKKPLKIEDLPEIPCVYFVFSKDPVCVCGKIGMHSDELLYIGETGRGLNHRFKYHKYRNTITSGKGYLRYMQIPEHRFIYSQHLSYDWTEYNRKSLEAFFRYLFFAGGSTPHG